MAEPVIAPPAVAEPVIDEPVVAEPVVDTDAKVHAADAGDMDAGDVDDWDTGASAAASKEAADKAEWESSWTDGSGTPVHHHEYTDAHSPTLPEQSPQRPRIRRPLVTWPSSIPTAPDHPAPQGGMRIRSRPTPRP